MALIACPECQREISSRAPACPHCGYPVKASLSTSTEPVESVRSKNESPTPRPVDVAKKRSSMGAWFLLVLLVTGAVFWYYQTEFVHDYGKPALPVTVEYRPALTGPGLVLKVNNTSTRHLTIIATLRNPTLNDSRSFRFDIPPQSFGEVGHREGWKLASGDRITLRHNDYQAWNGSIP